MHNTESIRENRLFRKLYAVGKSVADPYLAVYCMKNRTGRAASGSPPGQAHKSGAVRTPCNRLGLTVGVKVGKAVVRNRVRRRLREIYRLAEPRIAVGWDLVIVARARAADTDYGTLFCSLEKLLSRLKLLREQPRESDGKPV